MRPAENVCAHEVKSDASAGFTVIHIIMDSAPVRVYYIFLFISEFGDLSSILYGKGSDPYLSKIHRKSLEIGLFIE
jgi:hypothetical protein